MQILNYHEKCNERHYVKWSNWCVDNDDKDNENVADNVDEVAKRIRKMLGGSHG